MDFHYDLDSRSLMYRQEALREARKRNLAEQACGNSRPLFSSVGTVGSILGGVLSVLKC